MVLGSGRLRTQLPNSPAVGSLSAPPWKVVTTTTLMGILSSSARNETAKNASVATAITAARWMNFICFCSLFGVEGFVAASGHPGGKASARSAGYPQSRQNSIKFRFIRIFCDQPIIARILFPGLRSTSCIAGAAPASVRRAVGSCPLVRPSRPACRPR